jgi:GNAT superfamily N-acetyltransferase
MLFALNKSSENQVYNHLCQCSSYYKPQLDSYVNLNHYSKKLYTHSLRFDCFEKEQLIGLIAIYANKDIAFITNVSVLPQFQGKGIAQKLLDKCVFFLKENFNLNSIRLETFTENKRALNFYIRNHFKIIGKEKNKITMELRITRNYNSEIKDTPDHKYAYNFDTDIMQNYMVSSFRPFFKEGNLLELGSFKGEFTKRFVPYFEDITCVEASDEAMAEAALELGGKVKLVNALFETVSLPTKYNNIVMTHVLEHLDDPVAVLKRINDEWLSENGRFFLVCPNANAPSRQIAVKMGLISHNSAVTPAEKGHGHNITYTLDTLERDAKAAGLKVIYRSGIFFKAFANFQWDRLLETDIISKEYLDGCYELGQQYPDLCSSIFLLCEKGE